MFRSEVKIGPYILKGDRFIGKGSFGEVWKAVNENDVLDRIYAVKLPHDVDINSLLSGIEIAMPIPKSK